MPVSRPSGVAIGMLWHERGPEAGIAAREASQREKVVLRP